MARRSPNGGEHQVNAQEHHRPGHHSDIPKSVAGRDRPRGPAQPVCQGQGTRRTRHRRARARHRQASVRLCCTAWRQGIQPGRRSRSLVDCDFRAQGSGAVAVRDPRHAPRTRRHRDPAHNPPGIASDPAYAGAQERTYRGHVERDRLRECRLDNPEEPHEGGQAPQRLPVSAGAGHHGGAADLCRWLALPAALAL